MLKKRAHERHETREKNMMAEYAAIDHSAYSCPWRDNTRRKIRSDIIFRVFRVFRGLTTHDKKDKT